MERSEGMKDRRIVLCTGNPGKLAELKVMLPDTTQLLSLDDVGLPTDLPESGETLEANALQKARAAFLQCGLPCIADDTGLEVDALDGAPGVYSARYAGAQRDAQANMDKLLEALKDEERRSARFRTVLAYIDGDGEHCFEGVVEGRIALSRQGAGGFGYDPIFLPEGSSLSFAEMSAGSKNRISHRGRALVGLMAYLKIG